jgi:hypothetical protein
MALDWRGLTSAPQNWAAIALLVETCKLNPLAWMADTLGAVATGNRLAPFRSDRSPAWLRFRESARCQARLR